MNEEEIFKPTFKVIYSLINDEYGNQNLYCQARNNFNIIGETNLGNIKDIVDLINENQQLKEEIERLKKELYTTNMTEEEMLERDHLRRYVEER